MNHWSRHAPQWNLVGPPLKPCAADLRQFETMASAGSAQEADAIVLGVTPEIICMRWPRGTRVLAVDRSPDMIRHHWRDNPEDTGRRAVCANWCALPLDNVSVDLAIGDGSLNAMSGSVALESFRRELHRVLRPSARIVLRIFTRPDRAESPADVFTALRNGRIGSFHAFKWRLAMSLHGSLEAGVRLADIWECWRVNVAEPGAVIRAAGWHEDLLKTIDVYRGVPTRYTFPTQGETDAIFSSGFERIACHTPDYELGDRCPMVEFRKVAA